MEELTAAKSVIDEQQAKDLLSAITKIPDLGLWGIIAAIVLIIAMVAVWYWWNNLHEKGINAENEATRAEEQAKTVTKNQEASADWEKAHEAVEAVRKENPDAEKEAIPPKPPEAS